MAYERKTKTERTANRQQQIAPKISRMVRPVLSLIPKSIEKLR